MKIHGFEIDSSIGEILEDTAGKSKGLFSPVKFTVNFNELNKNIAEFTLVPFPGCCGIVVSTQSVNHRPFILSSKQFHKIKEIVARFFGYTVMIATTQLNNFPEVIGAGKNDWKFIDSFRNLRTNNDIGIMIKHLKTDEIFFC